MKRMGPLSSILLHNRRSKSRRMKIVTEACREYKVDKAAVLEKESEPKYAEHFYGPVMGMGIAAISMTEHLKDADNGTFTKFPKEKPKLFETCSGNLKREQILISDPPMKKKPKLSETDSGKVERKRSSFIKDYLTEYLEGVSDDSDVEPGMDIKVFKKKPTPDEEWASFKRIFTPNFLKDRVFTPEDLEDIKKAKSWPLKVVETGEGGGK